LATLTGNGYTPRKACSDGERHIPVTRCWHSSGVLDRTILTASLFLLAFAAALVLIDW
jgi:hypothetical protein